MANTQDKPKSNIQFFDNGTQNVDLQNQTYYEIILKKAQSRFPDDQNAQRSYFIKEVAFSTPAAIQYKRKNPNATADDFMQHVQKVKADNNGMYVWKDETRKNPRKSGIKYNSDLASNYKLNNVAPEIANSIRDSYYYMNTQSDLKDMFMLFGDVDVKNNIVSTLDGEYGGNHKGLGLFGEFTKRTFGEVPTQRYDETVPVPPIQKYPFSSAENIPDVNTDFLPEPEFPSMTPSPTPAKSKQEVSTKVRTAQLPNPYLSLFPQEYVPGATWNLSQGLRPLDAVPLYTASNPGNAMGNNAISLASRTNRIDYQEEPIQQMNTSIMRQIDQSGMRGSARAAALLNSTNQNRMARGMNRTQVDTQNAAFAQQSNQQAASMYATIGAQNQQMNMNAQLQNNQYKANQYDLQQKQMAVRQDYLNTFFTNDIPVIGTEYYNRSIDYSKAATLNKIADKGFFNSMGDFQTAAQREALQNDPSQMTINQMYANSGLFNFGRRSAQVKK